MLWEFNLSWLACAPQMDVLMPVQLETCVATGVYFNTRRELPAESLMIRKASRKAMSYAARRGSAVAAETG